MKTSDKIDQVGPALLEAQKNMGAVRKGKTNPAFKSKYSDLSSVIDAIKGPLNDEGLWLSHPLVEGELGYITCEVYILHAASAQWVSERFRVPETKHDPQGHGSGGTYAQRYSLCSFFSLPQEDDDGNAAAKSTNNPGAVNKVVAVANKGLVPVTKEQIGKLKEMAAKAGLEDKDMSHVKTYDDYVAEGKIILKTTKDNIDTSKV